MTIKKIFFTGAIIISFMMLAGLSFYYFSNPSIARANPQNIGVPCYIDGLTFATATPKYITAGRATTTIGHTTLCDVTVSSGAVPTALVLTVQQNASSSPLSNLSLMVETSFDGLQWAAEPFKTFTSATATTSVEVYNPNFVRKFQQVASTTEVLSGSVKDTITMDILIPNPNRARYFKIYTFVPVGSQPSSVWERLTPIKEMY